MSLPIRCPKWRTTHYAQYEFYKGNIVSMGFFYYYYFLLEDLKEFYTCGGDLFSLFIPDINFFQHLYKLASCGFHQPNAAWQEFPPCCWCLYCVLEDRALFAEADRAWLQNSSNLSTSSSRDGLSVRPLGHRSLVFSKHIMVLLSPSTIFHRAFLSTNTNRQKCDPE